MQRERQELGRPRGSTAETQLRNDLAQGIRLLSHEKGNPDTEARRSLNGENASSDASGGKRVRPKEEAPKIRGESDPLIVLYGVSGNSDRLKEFFNEGLRTLWKWLNRRSQHRSYTRSGFDDCSIISMCRGHRSFGGAVPDYSAGFSLPAPDAETSISAEPGARKGHAGICAGAVRATGRPTAMVPEQHHWRAMVRCHRGI